MTILHRSGRVDIAKKRRQIIMSTSISVFKIKVYHHYRHWYRTIHEIHRTIQYDRQPKRCISWALIGRKKFQTLHLLYPMICPIYFFLLRWVWPHPLTLSINPQSPSLSQTHTIPCTRSVASHCRRPLSAVFCHQLSIFVVIAASKPIFVSFSLQFVHCFPFQSLRLPLFVAFSLSRFIFLPLSQLSLCTFSLHSLSVLVSLLALSLSLHLSLLLLFCCFIILLWLIT